MTRVVTWEPLPGTDGVLSVVRNVEICGVGIEYPLSSGPATFTTEDLVAAVASQDDPAVQSPRVWLGHPDDQRFHAGRTSPVGSAEPALGKVVNMRIEDQGMTLVGDIAGCPTWLAKIMASAYPSRSIEAFRSAETVTGHKWDLLITDLALLGVTWPGVSTIEDLQSLWQEEAPEGIEVKEENMTLAARAIEAQVNTDDIRRAFYEQLPNMEIGSWSWIRAQLQDPDELIIDDDEGGLFRASYEIKGEEITFSDPVPVKIQYVNASQKRDPHARTLLVNMLANGRTMTASWDQRAESRPESTKEDKVARITANIDVGALRTRLGLTQEQLPDDATEDQINEAIATGPNTNPSASATTTQDPPGPPAASPIGNPGGEPSPDQVPTNDNPAHAPQAHEASAQLPEGTVAVPADVWAQVQANAAAGARVAEVTESQRRDSIVANAVREGRISPAQRANFRSMFDRDPAGTENLLTASVDKGGLMANAIPVTATGHDPSPALDAAEDLYPKEWLPEVHAQSSVGTVTVEN